MENLFSTGKEARAPREGKGLTTWKEKEDRVGAEGEKVPSEDISVRQIQRTGVLV